MAHIDYYFATISPFTYLAGTRMEEVAKAHGATIAYKPLDIMGLFSQTGGVPPKDRHPNRQEIRAQELRRQAKKHDMPMTPQPMFFPTNPAPSSFAVINAAKADSGDLGALVAGFTSAVWSKEKNIAEADVIADILTQAGFDPALADADMAGAADTYARNLEEAVASGVMGAPFYIVDGTEKFWGQDKIEDLDLFLGGKL